MVYIARVIYKCSKRIDEYLLGSFLKCIPYIRNFSRREMLAKTESFFLDFKDSQRRRIVEFIFGYVYFWRFQGAHKLSEN